MALRFIVPSLAFSNNCHLSGRGKKPLHNCAIILKIVIFKVNILNTFYLSVQVGKFAKREKLVEILREVGTSRTMVFVETKRNCDFIVILFK